MGDRSEENGLLEKVLGYFNFSSGEYDARFANALDQLFRLPSLPQTPDHEWPWQQVGQRLKSGLAELKTSSAALAESAQAETALHYVFDVVLPAYLEFHHDLLFHQTGEKLFSPFFIVRVTQSVLAHADHWADESKVSKLCLDDLNDYIGHRPVPALETRKTEPYPHEYCRPIPIWLKGAGACLGRHQEIVEKTLELLHATNADILQDAGFTTEQLDELAIDPRAYDFEHPVNKRPNYQFGQWDPDHIDIHGRYTRFVVQQVTLEALTDRVDRNPPSDLSHDELVYEAAAVLAGVILMGAGITGNGPGAYHSEMTLSKLVPVIANYRDRFYNQLLDSCPPAMTQRLNEESIQRRQPFGAARQHLNAYLSNRRAKQLAHVRLALIYSRMGYPDAAGKQVDIVPTASARMQCRIECFITLAHQAMKRGDLNETIDYIHKIVDRLHRAIECGAIVDPWNILGFDGQFSLFPAYENSVRDHRVDDLTRLIEQIFDLMSQALSEAAVRDDEAVRSKTAWAFEEFSMWWHQFATHEVSSVDSPSGDDAFAAARRVADALRLWHKVGAEAGDVAFWSPHAEMFDSPKAYGLVIEALLERNDFVTTLALLMHWLERADEIPLHHLDTSYFGIATQWILAYQKYRTSLDDSPQIQAETWKMIQRFLDFQEANAGAYYKVPGWFSQTAKKGQFDEELEALFHGEEPDGDNLFDAAYEDVTYTDSTDDGNEGAIFEGGDSETSEDLQAESRRINTHISFLSCVAQLWQMAAFQAIRTAGEAVVVEKLMQWREQAISNYRELLELLLVVNQHKLSEISGDHQAMVEYDRQRAVKEFVLERIIMTTVSTASAARILSSAVAAIAPHQKQSLENLENEIGAEQTLAVDLLAAILAGDTEAVQQHFPPLLNTLKDKPLLYVPISKRGGPLRIVSARVRQSTIRELLHWLPRVGQYDLSRQLLDTARKMENDNPIGPGAITEFDALFETGFLAIIDAVVASSQSWEVAKEGATELDNALVECLEHVTQNLLIVWLNHSRTLRLSAVEKFSDAGQWKMVQAFIQRYGRDLFTQHFFNRGNIRSILHGGVETWIERVREQWPEDDWPFFIQAMGTNINRIEAINCFSMVLEAVLENFAEYRDYNSTTTQSDRGEYLYMFLDFLRLRTAYDRVSWNLKPIVMTHEVLVRTGHAEAAQMWRKALADRIEDEAEKYVRKLRNLQREYAMQMPTVADRIQERFVRPLAVDRICSLVKQAMTNMGTEEASIAFNLLYEEAEALVQEPSGVGLDIPTWLKALDEEVTKVELKETFVAENESWQPSEAIPLRKLSLEAVHDQIDSWTTHFSSEDDEEEE
ncbi:hypothetical protein DTL42_08655 [Bremerella cremea]|uniref:Uncharacterized protein n=1 Tax=Bremerella cremea TaxID=1031537 RepID=A0A368KTI8_9BACT|nr:hypothetical protein [Bremerella cremea]RCS52888.1 hypothetical protein DTL42_08655 [Bremerella cremea]